MASVTYAEFGANTEGVEVAKAFANGVRGKTVLVTGGNKNGLGFSAAHALASQSPKQAIITGRNVKKVQECIDALKKNYPDIDYRVLQVDLSS